MKTTSTSKVALITGGGSGIGLALARVFSRCGYLVVITGRDQQRLRNAAEHLRTDKARIQALPCDVRDLASVDKMLSAFRAKNSRLDVLINNAGVSHAPSPVPKLDPQLWNDVIETNLTGTFLVTRAALPLMQRGGTIVNNLSVAATRVFKGLAAYNASKAGALGFTNALREELREQGIRVLALLPGATDTDIWTQFWPDAPRNKMMSSETVAEAVLHAVTVPANATIEEIRIGPAVGVL
jgi:NAD(P)-dependent dehydrogenase (short-subunit alcohol dehydrogenase family)